MQFYEYKGYVIYPAPLLLVGSRNWKIGLIVKHNNSLKEYSSERSYPTQGEAVFHSIQYGKQLIDDGIVLIKEAV